MSTLPEFRAKLESLLEKNEPFDLSDVSFYDMYGGNIDDAFYGGYSYGRQMLLKDIRKLIKEYWGYLDE